MTINGLAHIPLYNTIHVLGRWVLSSGSAGVVVESAMLAKSVLETDCPTDVQWCF